MIRTAPIIGICHSCQATVLFQGLHTLQHLDCSATPAQDLEPYQLPLFTIHPWKEMKWRFQYHEFG